jgi:peptidylprolyl isomerase
MDQTKPQVTLPDGEPTGKQLRIDDQIVGDGEQAQAGQTAEVHYVGVSWNSGNEFDASWDRGDTFRFKLGGGQVIAGWDQGVVGMNIGGRRQLTIPPALGYGASGAGGVIGPNEHLVFVVDLISLR